MHLLTSLLRLSRNPRNRLRHQIGPVFVISFTSKASRNRWKWALSQLVKARPQASFSRRAGSDDFPLHVLHFDTSLGMSCHEQPFKSTSLLCVALLPLQSLPLLLYLAAPGTLSRLEPSQLLNQCRLLLSSEEQALFYRSISSKRLL